MSFTEEWLPSDHSNIKAWLVECCRDCCPSERVSHLYRGTPEHCKSDHQFLGHLPDQGPSPPIVRWRSIGGSKLLPFKNDVGHFVLGDLQCWRNVLVPFPRYVLSHNPVSELYRQFLWPYIDRCVPFLDHVQSIELIGSMETGCTWAQFRVSKQRVWILM